MERRNLDESTLDRVVLHWITLLPHGSYTDRAAFAAFICASPSHLRTYLKHRALTTELQGLDPHRRIDVGKLVSRARS